MTEDKKARLRASHAHRVALCGRYATEMLEAKVLERLRLLIQLRVSLWRPRWALGVASLQRLRADAYRVDPVKRNEVRAAEA